GDHPDGISSFQSQSACKKIRPVVERFRSLNDAILGVLGDGTRCGGVVQGGRHRPRGKPKMTDLFEHREVKPHFINPCCFGEDFAAWLKQELLRVPDLGIELSEPIQEDYGWGLWASRGKDRFWVALSYVGDGPQEAPAQWVVSVTYDPGLNLAKRLFHKPDQQALQQL